MTYKDKENRNRTDRKRNREYKKKLKELKSKRGERIREQFEKNIKVFQTLVNDGLLTWDDIYWMMDKRSSLINKIQKGMIKRYSKQNLQESQNEKTT
jgi:hypothetical protein